MRFYSLARLSRHPSRQPEPTPLPELVSVWQIEDGRRLFTAQGQWVVVVQCETERPNQLGIAVEGYTATGMTTVQVRFPDDDHVGVYKDWREANGSLYAPIGYDGTLAYSMTMHPEIEITVWDPNAMQAKISTAGYSELFREHCN